MFPSENADEEQQSRDDPRDSYHPDYSILCPPTSVFGCDFYRTEAVDRDEKNGVLRY